MRVQRWIIPLLLVAIIGIACKQKPAEEKLRTFIDEYVNQVKPLENKLNKARFEAAVSGNPAAYKKVAELEIRHARVHADKDAYNTLKSIEAKSPLNDSLLERQLEILLHKYQYRIQDHNLTKQMIRSAADIRQKFSIYRPELGDTTISIPELQQILTESTNPQKLEEVWKAGKQVGVLVANDFIRLAHKRNKKARKAGFDNYHSMQLHLNGQDPKRVDSIFRKVEELTKNPYKEVKSTIDKRLAKRFNIPENELMPWHYQNQFFQTAPQVLDINFNSFYKGRDIVKLAREFYGSIKLPVNAILKNSDLKTRPGKRQYASTFPINRKGDVRIIGNVSQDAYSMSSILYELGFALYYKHIPDTLPYLLRKPAHFMVNDAVAIMFGNRSYSPEWLKAHLGKRTQNIQQVASHFLSMEKLVFARWAIVMYRFEKGLYENPGRDLNTFWWDLVEKHQMLKRPKNRDKPDWAAKQHFFNMPCQYHNYLLGELFASQLRNHINQNILPGNKANQWHNQAAIGSFLSSKIFNKGATATYCQQIEEVTGEPLQLKYFKKQYIKH